MKLLKLYTMAMLAMVLYSCTNDELLVENIVEPKPVPGAISFDQGFVDKGTRAGIALSDYQQSMGVWGYRDPVGDNEMVFNNQQVSFNSVEGWTYSPLKYWDVLSNYDFYAYTPHNTSKVTLDKTLARAYLINIENIALNGVNLQSTASAAEKMIFDGTADTDWMISRAAQKNVWGSSRNTVQFSMQHILSKLNIRMRISASMASLLGEDSYVTVDKITVGKLLCKGDFTQKLSATPSTAEEKQDSEDEWNLAADEITLEQTTSSRLTSDNLYLLESLVLPQEIDVEDKVYIEYTIHYSDHTEKFKASKLLRDISPELYHLYTGYNYTLSFLIDSDAITFTANAANWDERE